MGITGVSPISVRSVSSAGSAGEDTPWYTAIGNFLSEAYDSIMGENTSAGLAGCMPEGETYADQDSSIPVGQGDPPDGSTCTDGGICVDPDGGVYLPDAGNGYQMLPGDTEIWIAIEGSGNHFEAINLANYQLYFHSASLVGVPAGFAIGTNSPMIGPTSSNPDIPTMPTSGCFPGQINITPANELVSCSETGYSEFAVCPSNPNYRVPLYMNQQATITAYEHFGAVCPPGWESDSNYIMYDGDGDGENECFIYLDEEEFEYGTIDQMLVDINNGTEIGTYCGTTPAPVWLPLPSLMNSSADRLLIFDPGVCRDARQVDENAPYLGIWGVKFMSEAQYNALYSY